MIGDECCCDDDAIDCTVVNPNVLTRFEELIVQSCPRWEPTPALRIGETPPATVTVGITMPDGRLAPYAGPFTLDLVSYGLTSACQAGAFATYYYAINPPTYGGACTPLIGVDPACTGGTFINHLLVQAFIQPRKDDSYPTYGVNTTTVTWAVNACAGTKEYMSGNQFFRQGSAENGNCYPLAPPFGEPAHLLCTREVGKSGVQESISGVRATIAGTSALPTIPRIVNYAGAQSALNRDITRWLSGSGLSANAWRLQIGDPSLGSVFLPGPWTKITATPPTADWYRHDPVSITLNTTTPRATLQATPLKLFYLTEFIGNGGNLCAQVAGLPDPVPAGTAFSVTPPGIRFSSVWGDTTHPLAAGGFSAMLNKLFFDGGTPHTCILTLRVGATGAMVESVPESFIPGTGWINDWANSAVEAVFTQRHTTGRFTYLENVSGYVIAGIGPPGTITDCPYYFPPGGLQLTL